ncbi:ABC transporter permease [Bordetella sp. 02P26C-1]|uniref:ABC transporter permease n=1 Tax=Bordetella sp. 02P26C-1 TaxID=2683195 RepID=UPI001353EC1B|nr:ABC transporter permease [Bordetella sp. 02P26C-1]MVW79407.1 ABC transporter permease [Bordetella sp. 02P26C-1]
MVGKLKNLAYLRPIWRYRGFILQTVKREFQAKYRNSTLGAAWNIIQPLAMILVYTLIFSQVMRAKLPGVDSHMAYSIYLCAGILTWGLFAEISGRCLNVFLDNANLLKKVSFPRICLPVIVVLGALMNFAIIFLLFTVVLVITGNFPGRALLGLAPLLVIQVLFSMGLGMMLGVMNVFFRDVGQFFTVAIQFWFWFTPIVYPFSILPPTAQHLMQWNPMAPLIGGYQKIMVMGQWPDWSALLPVFVLSLVLCAGGLYLFRRHAGDIVDEL